MKQVFFFSIIMMLFHVTGVSQANENMPIEEASAAHTLLDRGVAPDNTIAAADKGMEFVHVTGGCYCMGDAGARSLDAAPVHNVCIDDYYIGKYEVTQAQWREIMGNNPATMNSCGDNCPVVDVSWNDVQEFTRRLNERTGKSYRLPTEAEWEYAARIGGSKIASAASNDGKPRLRPVGRSQPSSIGINDMLGSVWEWTGDKYSRDYYRNSPQSNPEGPSEGSYQVLRGGSWDDSPQSIQPTLRASLEPSAKRPWAGFRLLSPDQLSAKYNHPDVLAPVKNAKDNRQCGQVQQALIR
jgi:sulfatase modifying factor 1